MTVSVLGNSLFRHKPATISASGYENAKVGLPKPVGPNFEREEAIRGCQERFQEKWPPLFRFGNAT